MRSLLYSIDGLAGHFFSPSIRTRIVCIFFSFLALNLFIPYSKKQILPGMKSLHCADVAVCDHFIHYVMASLVRVLKKLVLIFVSPVIIFLHYFFPNSALIYATDGAARIFLTPYAEV